MISKSNTEASRALALAAARAAVAKKATDIRILDLGELLGITDFFVIASAQNERQLATIAEAVEQALEQDVQRRAERREGGKETGWMLLDYGEIVVHVFATEQREFYSLERLWADAPVVEFDELAHAAGG